MEEKTKRRTIWQDAIYEDEADYKEAYSEYLEMNGLTESDKSLGDFMADEASLSYDAEVSNLDIPVPDGIITIADLGLWNGRRSAHDGKDLSNVNQCLRRHCGGYMKFFVEDGDFKAEESHHDGTNVYTYRAWKDGVTEDQKTALRDALYCQDTDKASDLIEKYTESLVPTISKVYGW